MRKLFVLLALALGAVCAQAGVTNCNFSPGLEPDGRATVNDSAGAGATNFYFIHVLAGHSYAVEVTNRLTSFGADLVLGLLTGNCGATNQTFSDITAVDPSLSLTNGDRISFVAAASTSLNVSVNNPNGTTFTYDIRMVDTTLHNPRWSTFSSFITQYAFRNTTSSAINATLTVTTTLSGGTPPGPQTVSFSVPASGEVFKIVSPTGDVTIAAQNAGFATLTFVGPPGAIIADAYFINPSSTVIVFGLFGPRDYQR